MVVTLISEGNILLEEFMIELYCNIIFSPVGVDVIMHDDAYSRLQARQNKTEELATLNATAPNLTRC